MLTSLFFCRFSGPGRGARWFARRCRYLGAAAVWRGCRRGGLPPFAGGSTRSRRYPAGSEPLPLGYQGSAPETYFLFRYFSIFRMCSSPVFIFSDLLTRVAVSGFYYYSLVVILCEVYFRLDVGAPCVTVENAGYSYSQAVRLPGPFTARPASFLHVVFTTWPGFG